MSYIALYRKWRPSVFEDVVEQEHVVKTLKNSICNNRIAHAYLFCGTRGTGKTTMAKIFSRAINCLNPNDGDPCNECEICTGILNESILDIIEIDAASNNGVDNVREIRDEVVYVPSKAKYKVYIIDEVHMLSTGAYNALLKTLEEPPSHVVFILATTDPHKLPATILSRCQRFDFRRITVESIADRISLIADESGVDIKRDAARLIGKLAEGALRDAISILDQCISLGSKEVTYDNVMSIVGIVNDTFIASIVDGIINRNVHDLLCMLDELVMQGKDISQFVSDLIQHFRNLLICKIDKNPGVIVDASEDMLEMMLEQSKGFERDEIVYLIMELSSLEQSLKWSSHSRVLVEVGLIKICERSKSIENSNILERLTLLEERINNTELAPKPLLKDNKKEEILNKIKSNDDKKAPKKTDNETVKTLKGSNLKPFDNWSEILTELKNSGRMVVYTNLIGTNAIELDSKFIGIIFSGASSFSKNLISKPENTEILEALLSKRLSRPMRIKCLDDDSLNQDVGKSAEEDEFIGKVKAIGERFDVPVNIIDE